MPFYSTSTILYGTCHFQSFYTCLPTDFYLNCIQHTHTHDLRLNVATKYHPVTAAAVYTQQKGRDRTKKQEAEVFSLFRSTVI